ncbi:MAG: nucleotidyl transferase AbiEii/AbiGii toxin family protein [bacterium]
MLAILKAIYADSLLGPALGFKGGTAAYLFYDLGRFSVDLDFDLLYLEKEKDVFAKMALALKDFGAIKESYIKKNTLFFLLSYGEKDQNIKIEISRRTVKAKYNLETFLGVSMLVMDRADMASCKLAALINRKKTASRDIFDTNFFIKNSWDFNEEVFKQATGLDFKKGLAKAIAVVKSFDQKEILANMGELLDEKQKKWAKENLKADVLFALKSYLFALQDKVIKRDRTRAIGKMK